MCFASYITISQAVATSRSGRYATDLPGIDTAMLTAIARSTSENYATIWPTIYNRACRNMVADFSKNIQNKFLMNAQLVTRETSEFKDTPNSNSGLAGMLIEFNLPKYSKLHILSISVYSHAVYAAAEFKIYDTDENGELLATITSAVAIGRNTINVDTDFEVDKVFVSFDPAIYTYRETENKHFATPYISFDEIFCDFCFWDSYRGAFTQVNGGGLNVKYNIYCSVEKLVCENLNLFADALLYKIGHEITVERRLGERLNKFTVMIQERWDELEGFYNAQYQDNLMNIVKSKRIPEDQVCFTCSRMVTADYQIP